MNFLKYNDISKIVDHDFSLDFLRARLVQQVSENPKVYSGSGYIAQADNGALELTIYCPIDSAEILVSEFNRAEPEPGQLITDEYHFSFEGQDLEGRTWKATNAWVSQNVSFAASGIVARATLASIESKSTRTAPSPAHQRVYYVPGIVKIPFTSSQPGTPEPGLSACVIELGQGRRCELKTRGKTLEVRVIQKEPEHEKHPDIILEALSFATGRHLVAIVEQSTYGNEVGQIVRSITSNGPNYGHSLSTPVSTAHPSDFRDFQTLVQRYADRFDERSSQLIGYWYRVLGGFGSSLENQALILTTSIEGVLKSYFQVEGQPAAEFVKEAQNAKVIIENLDTLGNRIKGRILGSIRNAEAPSPKNALYALSNSGDIPSTLVSVWTKLRNQSAHADELKFSPEKMQKLVDELYACLELFYQLSMLVISYKESIVRYSIRGWPNDRFESPTPQGVPERSSPLST